jgi:hypothetical protein
MAIRTFGAEGRRRHVGSFLHNKTHMAQAALAFRQRPYGEGFPTRPKPYTDRKWLAWPNEGDASEDQLPQQTKRSTKPLMHFIDDDEAIHGIH